MKFLIYARVSPRGSTYEGETSIPMQINYCREYVKFHGGEVVDVRSDEFFSGKDTHRPAFRTILNELETGGGDWDTLIVYKLSRMTRSLRDGAAIFEKLFQHGRGFVSATENLDFSSPAGRAMLGMMQVFNQFEREQSAENTRNKMLSIAARGEWPSGNPPFGYKRGERKDNRLYVDERNSAIVRDIFEMYASSSDRTREIISKYRGTVSKTQLFLILRNRIYLGKIVYAGKEFEGKHEAIIPQELFDRVQKHLPERHCYNRPKAQQYPYLLTGLVYCHCGNHMTPQSAKSGAYNYYCCRNESCRTRVSAPEIEQKAVEYLKSLDVSKETIDEAISIIRKRQEEERSRRQPEIDQVESAIRQCEKDKATLLDTLVASRGNLNAEFLNALNEKAERISTELDRLLAKREILNKDLPPEEEFYNRAIETLRQLRNVSDNLLTANDPVSLRQVLLAGIDRIQLTKEGDFQIYGSSPNCKKWQPMRELFELLFLRFSIEKNPLHASFKRRRSMKNGKNIT